MDIARFLLPLIIVLTVAGMASSFLQNPPSLIFHRIKPDFSKLSPARGFTRIFGQQGRVEFLKSFFKLSAALVVGYVALRAAEYQVLSAMHVELSAIPQLVLSLTLGLISSLAVGALVLAGADVAWSRFFWQSELRMTRQELKDEHKQMEGDPLVKMRMRSIARDRARRRMIQQTSHSLLRGGRRHLLCRGVALCARRGGRARGGGQGKKPDRAKNTRNCCGLWHPHR